MNKKIAVAVFAVLGLSSAAPSYAQWYVGASAGKSDIKFDDAAQSDQFLDLGFDNPRTTSSNRDTGFRAFGGYQLHKYVAAELTYVDLGRFNFRTDVTPTGTLSGLTKISGVELSVLGTVPVTDRFSVLARVGAFAAETKTSYTGTGSIQTQTDGETQKKKGTQVSYGAGVSYMIDQNVSVRGEWSRFTKLGDVLTGGKTDANLYSVGLVYRF